MEPEIKNQTDTVIYFKTFKNGGYKSVISYVSVIRRGKKALLKVLSSEMDPAEIRLIRRGTEVFRKNPHVPFPVRAL